jgi:N-acyl-D-amino-acid deacylase
MPAYVGHIALRLAAMGMEAWERAATPAEIARMAELLDDALAAGALGLSDNMHDHDGENRPVPSLLARNDAEFEALFDVMERYPATCYQVIVDTFMRMTGPANLERLSKLLAGRKIRARSRAPCRRSNSRSPFLPAMQASLEAMRAKPAWMSGRAMPTSRPPACSACQVADLCAVQRLCLA